jgi:DNA-binding beta-propeller fold protein YncE
LSLVRTAFVPLPAGARVGFDHADVSNRTRRLYVAHTGADRVEVIDCEAPGFLHSLLGLPGVAGVLIDEQDDLLFTSDRDAARVSTFRRSEELLHVRVAVGPHPNGLAYDRRRSRLSAFNLGEPIGENCTVTVIEVDAASVAAEIALPGRPRWAVYDPDCDRVFVNIRAPAEILAIDPEQVRIEGAFPVASAGPHGLWLDSGRLFCAADGGQLVVLDSSDGTTVTSLPLPCAPDVLMHDPVRRRLYVAIGDPGLVASYDTKTLGHVETVETEAGAHTTAWDPIGRRLYVFCPQSGGAAVDEDPD